MTIFGLSITKKSRKDALEAKIYELIGNISSIATDVAALIAAHEEHEAEIAAIKDAQSAIIATHEEYDARIDRIKGAALDAIDSIRNEVEPIKAFMKEHSKNILEAEEEFNKQQQIISDGMRNIADFNPLVKKQGDK